MKKLILVSAILLTCFTFDTEEKQQKIYFTRTAVGFNVYSAQKELLLEFTKTNTDSLSLETLKYIYEVAEEFNNKKQEKIK